MKKLITIFVLCFLAYQAYRQTGPAREEQLAGRWRTRVNVNGMYVDALLQLYDNNRFDSTFDAALNGRYASFTGSGTWKVFANTLQVRYSQANVPGFPTDKAFGGFIQSMDDRTMKLRDSKEVETWYRVGKLASKK